MSFLELNQYVYSPILGMGIVKQVCNPHQYQGEQYYVIFFADSSVNDGYLHIKEEWILEELAHNFNDMSVMEKIEQMHKCYLKPINITITHTKD